MKHLLISFAIVAIMAIPGLAKAAAPIDIVMFYGQGCPHCTSMEAYLTELQAEYPEMVVHRYEVFGSQENQTMLLSLAKAYGTEVRGVPTLFIGNDVIKGNEPDLVKASVDACRVSPCTNPLNRLTPVETTSVPPAEIQPIAAVEPSEPMGDTKPNPKPEQIPEPPAELTATNAEVPASAVVAPEAKAAVTDTGRNEDNRLSTGAKILIGLLAVGLGLAAAKVNRKKLPKNQ